MDKNTGIRRVSGRGFLSESTAFLAGRNPRERSSKFQKRTNLDPNIKYQEEQKEAAKRRLVSQFLSDMEAKLDNDESSSESNSDWEEAVVEAEVPPLNPF